MTSSPGSREGGATEEVRRRGQTSRRNPKKGKKQGVKTRKTSRHTGEKKKKMFRREGMTGKLPNRKAVTQTHWRQKRVRHQKGRRRGLWVFPTGKEHRSRSPGGEKKKDTPKEKWHRERMVHEGRRRRSKIKEIGRAATWAKYEKLSTPGGRPIVRRLQKNENLAIKEIGLQKLGGIARKRTNSQIGETTRGEN